jgi:hypothetical protein
MRNKWGFPVKGFGLIQHHDRRNLWQKLFDACRDWLYENFMRGGK